MPRSRHQTVTRPATPGADAQAELLTVAERLLHPRGEYSWYREAARAFRRLARRTAVPPALRDQLIHACRHAHGASGWHALSLVHALGADRDFTAADATLVVRHLLAAKALYAAGWALRVPQVPVDVVYDVLCTYPAMSAVTSATKRADALADPRIRVRLLQMHSSSMFVLHALARSAEGAERAMLIARLMQRRPARAAQALAASHSPTLVARDTLTGLLHHGNGAHAQDVLLALHHLEVVDEALPDTLPAYDPRAKRHLQAARATQQARRGR